MDRLLGNIIDDYTLFRVIQGFITVFVLVAVYFGIQIILLWKFLNKDETDEDKVISDRKSFIRSSIFIFIAGFFMIVHNFFESLEKSAPDFTTNEFFELIALIGLVLFLYEWHKILKKLKRKQIN